MDAQFEGCISEQQDVLSIKVVQMFSYIYYDVNKINAVKRTYNVFTSACFPCIINKNITIIL